MTKSKSIHAMSRKSDRQPTAAEARLGAAVPDGREGSATMSATEVCDQALALLLEAQRLLEELVEKAEVEEGSPPHATLWYLEDAIGMLTPLTPDEERLVGSTVVQS